MAKQVPKDRFRVVSLFSGAVVGSVSEALVREQISDLPIDLTAWCMFTVPPIAFFRC